MPADRERSASRCRPLAARDQDRAARSRSCSARSCERNSGAHGTCGRRRTGSTPRTAAGRARRARRRSAAGPGRRRRREARRRRRRPSGDRMPPPRRSRETPSGRPRPPGEVTDAGGAVRARCSARRTRRAGRPAAIGAGTHSSVRTTYCSRAGAALARHDRTLADQGPHTTARPAGGSRADRPSTTPPCLERGEQVLAGEPIAAASAAITTRSAFASSSASIASARCTAAAARHCRSPVSDSTHARSRAGMTWIVPRIVHERTISPRSNAASTARTLGSPFVRAASAHRPPRTPGPGWRACARPPPRSSAPARLGGGSAGAARSPVLPFTAAILARTADSIRPRSRRRGWP